ncbi:MAG TPA: hypothetical protein DCL40_01825 [Coxiellaceae bacterium]|nr:hypothetical protein [Coxiellaceae bacterium]
MCCRVLSRCLIFLMILCLVSCRESDKASHPPGKHGKQGSVINVALTHICPQSVDLKVSSSARLYATEHTALIPKVAGYIAKIPLSEGSFVKQGETIIQLDDKDQIAQLAAAKISKIVAGKQLKRGRTLVKSEGISKQDLESLQQAYDLAVNTVEQKQIDLDNMSITAPFDGFVGQITVSVGDYVTNNSELTTLVNSDHLRAVYSLPGWYAKSLALKQAVSIQNYKGSINAPAQVSFIARAINPETQTIAVTATLDNPKHHFYPGQDVMITQHIGQKNNVLLVPRLSVQTDIGSYSIYTVKDNKAVQVNIAIGDQYGDDVEVLKGLSANDTVVTSGMDQLHQGSSVKVASTDECGQ